MTSRQKVILAMMGTLVFAGCGGNIQDPPVAQVRPHELEIHGDTRTDNYYWLREKENPEVITYLEAENAYLEAAMSPVADFQSALFEEMKGRIKEDDSSAPYELRGYWYYTRFIEGGEYALHCRRPGSMEGAEQIMFDGNALAEGTDYFSLRRVNISPDNKLAVYGIDTGGRRFYTLRVKDLETGRIKDDVIPNVTGNTAWAMDNQTIFYGRQDPETLRSYQIWRHTLGTDPAGDVLVYEEKDDTFSCYVWRTKSDRFLGISCSQTLSSEVHLLAADDPTGQFRVFQARQKNMEYSIDHQADRFLIRTNLHAKNFRLMECGLGETGLASWQEVIPNRDDVLLEGFEVFTDWLVLSERFDGLNHLRVLPMDDGEPYILDFRDPTWSAWTSVNPRMDTDVLRFGYTSLTTPRSTFDYDMKARTRKLVKQQEVLGGFSPDNYKSEYVQVIARDGARVPVSLVYREGFVKDGKAPLLLYAYGSYGYSMDAGFRSSLLSLLDRGFVYAIAHVRGGEELGRQWYEEGKLLKKKNTFNDFIDCGKWLVQQKYSAQDGLFAMGGSAGGLLVGAVVNMEPEMWRGVVAQVPYVDVVTTMLDDSIPLTTSEYDEWGNPNDKTYYDYMLSYSPYDNVVAQDYPAMLVTTGLNDSQVQYFEPAKWVAKLRVTKTDDNLLLLKINMGAGHGGASGRFRRLEETALGYAFLCDLVGISR
ncbi:MAG: S9 family peptidase [Gemmatimonadales bacterium]|nr:S9 family peptidase [Gemmatimonadales bacterium]